ncbi:MAG: hypothetical protein GWM98_18965, partial [Nitrospinaceae bacterium]|nr:1-acyl-sn-glycerol-3-phosphate acyltransferase [Nitrospinaceae bacterium]NIR56184.1 1-acyl-sn-glycerol-3-phosphate acyltransferase [Nitrospinaceae bacterium]NIS86640.1 1-acyl-sn-glycerol-3-phosphate acyltransferase [Nitrospinaceae bacterium]NIT83473.1 1-acyl-sn-glycerol-3-phosphate acyltransferase [Nitrospinaceae bacterium]NIU45678.1 1-acyl-sn-glycerol-3-phosphate acyltransferase [Nitrospinaceae bacterium]
MKTWRLCYRSIGLLLVQVVGGFSALLATLVLAPWTGMRLKAVGWLQNQWGRWCCRILNIDIQCEGGAREVGRGALIVSNHVGSTDIMVMAACFPVIFVSKSEVRTWPFVGWLTRLAGTIYVDRTRRSQVSGMVRSIAERLRGGFLVSMFPEGGATSGERVERFMTSAFEAAVQAARPVIPVMIRYSDEDNSQVAIWRDEVNFAEHFLALVCHPGLKARVCVLPEISGETDRRILAQKSQHLISDAFERYGKTIQEQVSKS